MRPISPKTKAALLLEPRMKECALKKYIKHDCSKILQWHHNMTFQGRQCDDSETILAVCLEAHRIADITNVKERLDWIMLYLMSDQQIKFYSKGFNYSQRKKYLTDKFGKYES